MPKAPDNEADLSKYDPHLVAAVRKIVEAEFLAKVQAAGGAARWEGSRKKERKAEMKRVASNPRPGRLKNVIDQPGRCECGRVKGRKHCTILDPKAPGGKRSCTLADRPKFD